MIFSLSVFFTVVHIFTFYMYQANYARLRKNERYARPEKPQLEKMPLARKLTKFAFVWSSAFVLASFWMPEGSPGFHTTSVPIRFSGLLVTFLAFLGLRKSLSYLGENYSPLFDTHRPYYIVENGPYKKIRHPVYLCNMLIILGYVISSSADWVLPSALWGWGYMIRSILSEEKFLASEFPSYREYQKKTWRIIPFIF